MNELTTFPKLVVVDNLALSPLSTTSGASSSNASQQQNEVEVGSSIQLTAKMPLTFYIQQAKQPEF